MYLIAFPLLLIPFVLYNMVAYLLDLSFTTTLFDIPLLSGAKVAVSTGDMLVILGVLLLYLEILKATRLASKGMMDHVLSVALFIAMAAQFAMAPPAATPTFLILMALSFVDVIGGFTIAAGKARRDVSADQAEQFVTHG